MYHVNVDHVIITVIVEAPCFWILRNVNVDGRQNVFRRHFLDVRPNAAEHALVVLGRLKRQVGKVRGEVGDMLTRPRGYFQNFAGSGGVEMFLQDFQNELFVSLGGGKAELAAVKCLIFFV